MPPPDVGSVALDDGGAELKKAACGHEAAPSAACDPYAPAESLRLRIGEDIDWSDVGAVAVAAAAVLERDDSTKGAAANPKCAARRSAATARSSLSSAPAPRAAVAVAVAIGGLLPAARDHGRRRSPCRLPLPLGGGRARVFASGDAAGLHQQPEPGSPKVSCLGGVRSQPRAAAEGVVAGGGRRWWPWLVADVVFCCCWNGRRDRRPTARASEAE